MPRNGHLTADVEKRMLYVREHLADVSVQTVLKNSPYMTIQFVHIPQRLDPCTVLVDARTIGKTGRASVTGTGVNFR